MLMQSIHNACSTVRVMIYHAARLASSRLEVSALLVSTNESVEAGNVLIFSDYAQSGE